MPEGYQWGMFFHLLSVFALGGGIAVSFATFSMMRRAGTVQEVRTWSALGRILSQYFVMPLLSLALLLSGAYLVDKLHHEWSEGWIAWSTAGLILATVVGGAVITPRMKAIGAAAGPAPDGPLPAPITERLNDPVLFAAVHGNLMVTLAIIWNMVIRPGNFRSLLSIVLLGGLGMAAALPAYLRHQRPNRGTPAT